MYGLLYDVTTNVTVEYCALIAIQAIGLARRSYCYRESNTVAVQQCDLVVHAYRGSTAMASIDYIVATFARDDHVQAIEPHILSTLSSGKKVSLYGYTGLTHNSVTYAISYNGGRAMVAGTGDRAHDAASTIQAINPSGLSVARLDIQETVIIDNPDRAIVFLTPKKVYKATRISSVNEEGETLYIGAPKSRARLRIYNKSAESGIVPESGKYLRVEVQLRDRYADLAYAKYLDGLSDQVLSYWIDQMLDASSARDLLNLCRYFCVQRLGQWTPPDESWVDRRKAWFERSVVPAMAKLLIEEPEYLETAIRLLSGNGKSVLDSVTSGESDGK